MRSLNALRNVALDAAKDADPNRMRELGDVIAELVLHVEAIQRQIDEARRHDIRRRAGSS